MGIMHREQVERRDTRRYWLVGLVIVAGLLHPVLGVLGAVAAAVSMRHSRFQSVFWAIAVAWLVLGTVFGSIGARGGGMSTHG
ncbi:MAG: hypothetical protein ACXVGI_10125 [Mycobacteriaceae bacterium]